MDFDILGPGKMFPPGFRFHPTDEELVLFYLKGKICRKRHADHVIGETDVYKWDPHELPGLSKLKTGDRLWFFFSPRDRKYPNGTRSSRATMNGYWKVTGKDRVIRCGSRSVGIKKTLVFYGGRAPNGARTDWVMHEYTMNEKELERCETAEDYYALYKVFKKSGPGPKNGEQYGAPFREEDWAEEELGVQCFTECENPVKKTDTTITAVDDKMANCDLPCSSFDIEGIMNQLADDSMLALPPVAADYVVSLDQLLSEEANQSSSTVHPINDTHSLNLESCGQQPHGQSSFEISQSETTHFLCKPPEVASQNPNRQEPFGPEVDFLEDFLELNDLISPDVQNLDNPLDKLENLPIHEFDCLNELDLDQDAFSHLCGMWLDEPGQISHTHTSNLENSFVDPIPSMLGNKFDNHTVNCDSHLHFISPKKSRLQLSTEEPRCNAFSVTEADQEFIPSPTSGGYQNQIQCQNNCNVVNFTTGTNEIEAADRMIDGTDSCFSSALWAFVESIPTTPASASENALVNRAFERMSSFSRMRINARNMNIATGNSSATSRISGKSRSGFLCISLIGVMYAILLVLIGPSFTLLC